MAQCTAPVNGHRSPESAAACPSCAELPSARGGLDPRFAVPSRGRHVDVTRIVMMIERDSRLPRETMEDAAIHVSGEVRAAVALRPDAPTAVLAELARDENAVVRMNVASNESTPPSAFDALAVDRNVEVRVCATRNSAVPLAALRILLADEEYVSDSAVRAQPRRCIAALHGVDEDNTVAIDYLQDTDWLNLQPDSKEVAIALALATNP